jgi:hypothetical protein
VVQALQSAEEKAMTLSRRTLIGVLTAALLGAPASASAQGVSSAVVDPTTRAALGAERQRLRGDLERVNAEIDALKRGSRGMRDDYRLRARLADAEALARRLTALDGRLGGSGAGGPGASGAAAGPASGVEPRLAPGDGPAELAAKADILLDQARRVSARAEALHGRAVDLRARQNLRRRVGQMERDPFSPLEGSKRRAVAGATVATASGNGAHGSGPGSPMAPAGDTKASDSANPPPAIPASGGDSTPPAVGLGGPTAASPGTTTQGAGSAVLPPKSLPSPTGAFSGTESSALSVQLRDLLDPTTLSEIQRLELTGGSNGVVDALERASVGLKARADYLARQAATLRASAHDQARPR